MKRRVGLVLAALVIAASVTMRADSLPVIRGAVSGIELCPESICGVAIFAGVFVGQVGSNPFALGTMSVAVKHDPLPPPDETANITGGTWQIQVAGRTIRGPVVSGSLFNNGDNTFQVHVDMSLSSDLGFDGVLSHNAFPPTIKGRITQ